MRNIRQKEKTTLFQKVGVLATIIYVLFCVLDSKFGSYEVEASNYIESEIIESPRVIQAQNIEVPEYKLEIDFNSSTYEDKKNFIIERLRYNNVSETDIITFVRIFELESCRNTSDKGCFDTRKTPPTIVYHCQKPNGTYTAIEIINKNGLNVQAYCSDYGWTQSGSEQSIGLAQILVSTWKGYGCEGDIRAYKWDEQVDCAVKIKNKSGFGAWSTYNLLSK